jgi:hypothetical protein
MSTPIELKNRYYILEFTITIFAILFQLCNCTWSLIHAYKKPRYNSMICLSMFLYLCAFVPLLRSTGITMTDVYHPQEARNRREELKMMGNLHNFFFCLGTFLYTIVIQTRLQCIQIVTRYSKWFDRIGLLVTIIVWTYLCLINVMILPFMQESNPILYGGLWSCYVVLVDNIVALFFLQKLLVSRSDLGIHVSKRQIRARRRLMCTLVCLALMTWVSLIFPFLGITVYKDNVEMRRLTYRVGICFSPVIYFGALVFVYSIQHIFAPQHDDGLSSYITSTNTEENVCEIKTGNKEYKVYIPKNKY